LIIGVTSYMFSWDMVLSQTFLETGVRSVTTEVATFKGWDKYCSSSTWK